MEVHAHMLSYVKVEMRLHMFDSCSVSLHGFTWILPHLHHAAAYRTHTCNVHVTDMTVMFPLPIYMYMYMYMYVQPLLLEQFQMYTVT